MTNRISGDYLRELGPVKLPSDEENKQLKKANAELVKALRDAISEFNSFPVFSGYGEQAAAFKNKYLTIADKHEVKE